MMRLNFLLLLAVVASAFFLVRTQYESRRLYAELEKASSQYAKLEIEHERLQVEKRGQATPLRVEKLAKDRLQMRTVTPAITQYVSAGRDATPGDSPAALPAGRAQASAAAAPASASAAGTAGSRP